MERQHIAYLILVVIALALGAWGFHARHNTRERKLVRQRARETDARNQGKLDRL